MWFVYILKCADGSLYTGITMDLKRRLKEHNTSSLGAKYTSGRRPVRLVYSVKAKNKSWAAKKECLIKGMTRLEKIKLIGVKKPRKWIPACLPDRQALRLLAEAGTTNQEDISTYPQPQTVKFIIKI
jgi:putative endonuclease